MKRFLILTATLLWLAGCTGTSTYVAASYGYPDAYPYAYPYLYTPYPGPGTGLFGSDPLYLYNPRWSGPSHYRHRMFTPPHLRHPFPFREDHRGIGPPPIFPRHSPGSERFDSARPFGPGDQRRSGPLAPQDRHPGLRNYFGNEGRFGER